MTIDKVNYLNIGLMVLSCAVAFILPFELLLFSYVILGPLHYLTEISWLHKRQFFTPRRLDYRILIGLSLFILLPSLFKLIYRYFLINSPDSFPSAQDFNYFIAVLSQFAKVMIFVVFAAAALILLVQDKFKRTIGIILILGIGLMLRKSSMVNVAFAVFIPSLIHVYIFTGAFMLLGALRGRSRSGMLSFAVFIGCAVLLLVIRVVPFTTIGGDLQEVYNFSFYKLNRQVFTSFLNLDASSADVYFTKTGIIIARFIAYAYTYHYLNWFSKTSVIKWHILPRRTVRNIIIIWIGSLILYFASYRTGFAMLYFLSMLHVILEFPLNFQSFRDIGNEIKYLFVGRPVATAPAFSEWEDDLDDEDEESGR